MFLRATNSNQPPRTQGLRARAAFTLVEIVLAIALATALLLVALTFYHQAADMRAQILRESDRFSAMRLVLDRLAGDLRAAQPQPRPGNEFTGDSASMHFIKEALTSMPSSGNTASSEPTDLVRVSLTTLTATNGTRVVVSGFDRVEEPLDPPATYSLLPTNSNYLSLYGSDPTNAVTEPFADMVRFVRFRYWDGAAWQAGWTNAAPPPGIEIILATELLADDAGPDVYPPESFRRVVFLPAGKSHPQSDTNAPPNFAAR